MSVVKSRAMDRDLPCSLDIVFSRHKCSVCLPSDVVLVYLTTRGLDTSKFNLSEILLVEDDCLLWDSASVHFQSRLVEWLRLTENIPVARANLISV